MSTINKYDGKTKHWLHLAISLFTGGAWVFAWMVINTTNESFYIKTQKAIREGKPAPSDKSWMLRVVLTSIFIYALMTMLAVWVMVIGAE